MNQGLVVEARRRWNDTGVDITLGQSLRILASGLWRDWRIETDADGFSRSHLKRLEPLRRVPAANWFQLCGTVDRRPDQAVLLGCDVTFNAPAGGRLYLFANDIDWMRWNNAGQITTRILSGDGEVP
jgi:hypothetical protein